MNLSFFTKIFGTSVQLSSSFGKTFSYVRDDCQYKDKVYQADIYRKNNTYTSCVFNGFKYMLACCCFSSKRENTFKSMGFLTLWNYLWFLTVGMSYLADPDEISPYATIYLGLHCLPKYLFSGRLNDNLLI